MNYNLIVRAGRNGTAKHMAYEGKTPKGISYISTSCGSDITNWGGRGINDKTSIEFKRENITCKKCLKAFDKQNQK